MIPSARRAVLVVGLLSALGACAPVALAAPGDISTVAGTAASLTGDGGPATAAMLSSPTAVASTPDGGFLITDTTDGRIRRVSAAGTITTVAGTTGGFSGDGGPATAAQLRQPFGVAGTGDGGFLIADSSNYVVRKVLPNGTITTVAGTPGQRGFSGDTGLASQAKLAFPMAVAPMADGGFLISDAGNNRIRRVFANGTIVTVAGSTLGFSGDGGPAVAAQLDSPIGVHPLADGGFLLADEGNQRIRRVRPDGTIVTVAGAGTAGLAGDGGPATSALLTDPHDVAATADGGFVIADAFNHRVRRVSPAGVITTVAGTSNGFSGDGGPATAAQLSTPFGVAPTTAGGLLIADTGNERIRAVAGAAGATGGAGGIGGGGAIGGIGAGPVVPGRGPSFGARTSVSISLTHRRIGSRAKLAVTVANANAFALSGSIAGRSRHTRPPNRLAAKRFAVAARGRTHLAFTLSRRLRSRLTRTGALAVVLTARVTDPAGHTRHVARTLTPRLKRARR